MRKKKVKSQGVASDRHLNIEGGVEEEHHIVRRFSGFARLSF
jgi:hypothetical protein